MAEYEACIFGLRLAIDMNIRLLLFIRDFDLLIHQVILKPTRNTRKPTHPKADEKEPGWLSTNQQKYKEAKYPKTKKKKQNGLCQKINNFIWMQVSSNVESKMMTDSNPQQIRDHKELAMFENVICRRYGILMDIQAVNDNDVHNIFMSYLAHNYCKDTLESFTASTGIKQTANRPEDIEKIKRIYHLALKGTILKAIELTEQFAPDLLGKNKDLHFDLLSLHFFGLVCSRKCTKALEFAQAKLSPFGKVQKFVKKLEDFIALLDYNEPEKSPMFHLLSLEYREQLVERLNREILANLNLPSYSAVERLMQQKIIVRQCLSQESSKV
ncbi:uncharacterized protein LOC107853429 [Capsicum annuum]|uniref:uncharacterized protein LOC107853429 n=1 Tax=Capsicum annuum TaxID=4072 RepID=UPI001FB06C6A|nr:uncharacterized protein LOC107853429 [Capsicum annuum]